MRDSTSKSSGADIYLAIVGDMEINRKDPKKVFEKVVPELQKADIRFGGLEASLSVRGDPAQGKIVMRHSPEMITGYLAGGFEVVAFASNHCLDYGMDPFMDTLGLLDRHRIRYVGAGRNIDEARRPAILEQKGTRLGFLSYLLGPPLGWGAHPMKAGVAPIRQDPLFGPPYVNEEDLEAMVSDIKKTKSEVDVLISSYHWGASQSRTLTVSQKAVAHAAIDFGADLIIGRHPHILQGIEVYKGKIIFYALGNFVLDHAHPMFTPTVKESILVKCIIQEKAIRRLSFVPVFLGDDGRPEILMKGDKRLQTIFDTLQRLSEKLNAKLHFSGNEALIEEKS
jgi:poly-gamma-glutamate capsule biosynthesis protein CapA/YwtB (metallophosphatase superfamily)